MLPRLGVVPANLISLGAFQSRRNSREYFLKAFADLPNFLVFEPGNTRVLSGAFPRLTARVAFCCHRRFRCEQEAYAGKARELEIRMSDLLLSRISIPRQRLVKLLGDIHFGRVERLSIRDGEPTFDDHLLIIRTVKIAGHSDPRPVLPSDFMLKRELVVLFQQLDRLGNGMVRRIEVAHGMPLLMELESTAA
jgi:hypothetical protein